MTGARSASNRTAMIDHGMMGWVTTGELAELCGAPISTIQTRIRRRRFSMVSQGTGHNVGRGGKIWLININDPAIPDSAREKYFAQLNRPRAEVILSTVEAMRCSIDELLREVKAFNLAFNRFADMFCSLCQDQDETTR